MKDPVRLCEIDAHGYEASLIRAARREMPRPSVQRASAIGLGLLSASTVAHGAATGGLATKWVLSAGLKGLLAGALVTGGAMQIAKLGEPNRPSQEPTVLAAATPKVATQALPPTPEPAASVYDLPPPEETRRASPVPAAQPERREPPEKTLTDEVAAFGRAQRALERGDPATALAALASFEREFPRAALAHEAEVLRIEALSAHGRREEALARARAFLTGNPHVPAARRIASLVARLENDPKGDQKPIVNPLNASEVR